MAEHTILKIKEFPVFKVP